MGRKGVKEDLHKNFYDQVKKDLREPYLQAHSNYLPRNEMSINSTGQILSFP